MEHAGAAALIVARSGPLRAGLVALLAAMPQIGHVEQLDPADAARAAVGRAGARRLAVALLVGGAADGTAVDVLRRIKAALPAVACIVLAEDTEQQKEASAAGADAALLIGVPAADLLAVVEAMLPRP